MRAPAIASLVLSLLVAGCSAREEAASQEPAGTRDTALERLLTERSSAEAFEEAVAQARAHKISEQAILEARFLFLVDEGDDEAIAALAPEFLKRRDSFDPAASEIFAVREDWLAVIEYVQAIAALRDGDRDRFKKHITEAFWLSPAQAPAFAPHIERLHLQEAMALVELDLASLLLEPLGSGPPVAFADVAAGKKALLLHFWSPWSPESEAAMPDFTATAEILLSKNIGVISILPESSPNLVADAKQALASIEGEAPGLWLVDREQDPLARTLRVRNAPAMVLVSNSGKVLFHGHPSDPAMWQALAEIDPSIERPAAREEP